MRTASRWFGGSEMVRDQAEYPRREEHRDVAQVGDVNLVLVVREDPGNDQVVGTGDEGNEADIGRIRTRRLQSG